jgi:hypothetical protein
MELATNVLKTKTHGLKQGRVMEMDHLIKFHKLFLGKRKFKKGSHQ